MEVYFFVKQQMTCWIRQAGHNNKSFVNLPNIITLSRVPLLFVVVGLLYIDARGIATTALLLYIIAAASDWLDGYIARKYNGTSNFGKFMDAITDKIFVIGLFITLQCLGKIPSWGLPLILVMLMREFMVSGLRMAAAAKNVVLAAEKGGKIKTICQMISLGCLIGEKAVTEEWLFLPDTIRVQFAWLVGWVGIILFVAGAVLTISSGYEYYRKYGKLLLS